MDSLTARQSHTDVEWRWEGEKARGGMMCEGRGGEGEDEELRRRRKKKRRG